MYELQISRAAQKEIAVLPRNAALRIRNAISELAVDPRPKGVKKLTGRDGWRIRIGDYRVIYDINDMKITVLIIHVGHRKDVYR